MGVLKRGRRRISINDRLYVWWVREDDDSSAHLLFVVSEDRRFKVQYECAQSATTKLPFVTVMGPEFTGLSRQDGCCRHDRTPGLDDDVSIPPASVRLPVEWCTDVINP